MSETQTVEPDTTIDETVNTTDLSESQVFEIETENKGVFYLRILVCCHNIIGTITAILPAPALKIETLGASPFNLHISLAYVALPYIPIQNREISNPSVSYSCTMATDRLPNPSVTYSCLSTMTVLANPSVMYACLETFTILPNPSVRFDESETISKLDNPTVLNPNTYNQSSSIQIQVTVT